MTKLLIILVFFFNFLLATKTQSIILSFPYNDESNQITLRKDFKLSQNFSFSPSVGLLFSLINLGFKYEEAYNEKGFIILSSIGYSPFASWTHGGKPAAFYHLSPSYQWKLKEYLYLSFGINYSIYYDFEEEKLYIPTKIWGERFSGILPFWQLSIKF